MNRTDFQELAKVRLNEAKSLLDQKLFDGAYSFGVRLVSPSHALVADVKKMHAKFPAPLQTQFGGAQLGKMDIEEALIYPPVTVPMVKPLKKPRSTIHSSKWPVS